MIDKTPVWKSQFYSMWNQINKFIKRIYTYTHFKEQSMWGSKTQLGLGLYSVFKIMLEINGKNYGYKGFIVDHLSCPTHVMNTMTAIHNSTIRVGSHPISDKSINTRQINSSEWPRCCEFIINWYNSVLSWIDITSTQYSLTINQTKGGGERRHTSKMHFFFPQSIARS